MSNKKKSIWDRVGELMLKSQTTSPTSVTGGDAYGTRAMQAFSEGDVEKAKEIQKEEDTKAAMAMGTAAIIPEMAVTGVVPTLVTTVSGLTGGLAGGYAGSYLDKKLDTKWIGPTLSIAGGLAGGIGGYKFITPRYGNLRFIRNMNGIPDVIDGKVMIAPNDNYLANFTTDLPFRTHSSYSVIPGGEYLIINPKGFRGVKPLSIEPSDSFFINSSLNIKPKHVTVISGNKEMLSKAKQLGYKIETSPELQEVYARTFNLPKKSILDKSTGDTSEYKKLVDEIITNRVGRPNYKDYKKLQIDTKLDAGVSPEVDRYLIQWKHFKNSDKLSDGFVYPNGRQVNPVRKGKEVVGHLPYKNIFYDPTSEIELNLMSKFYLPQHPKNNLITKDIESAIDLYLKDVGQIKRNGGKLNNKLTK